MQNVTYHCKKSIGYFDTETKSYKKGLKLVGFNDAEITPRGNPKMRYSAIEDECKVSMIKCSNKNILLLIFFKFLYTQYRNEQWGKTTVTYTTDRPSRLPIIDIVLRDFNEIGQSFSIHLSPVCFV